jgi:TRAP-type C4-dicarboxylate transport system permease small subunit
MGEGTVADYAPPETGGAKAIVVVAAAMVGLTVALTFAQVVLRYGFNNPQTWAEEAGRYLFVWITFLGAAVAFGRDSHIKVDAVVLLMSRRTVAVADIARRLVELAAVGMLLYTGVLVAWKYRKASFYTVPDMPQVVFYLAVPVGAALMLYFILRGFLAKLRR